MALNEKILPPGSRRRMLAGRCRRSALAAVRGLERRLRNGTDWEETQLKRHWAKYSPEVLDDYLVSGYQNPHINAQSIVVRQFLISKLFGSEFESLMHEEFEFCIETNEALRRRAQERGVTMGVYGDVNMRAEVHAVADVIADREDTFERRWANTLNGRRARTLSVLEFACGSANDYRFFHKYGIAQFLDYTGVDLDSTNIDNARERFPEVRFEVANVMELPYVDNSVDYVIAFDIFEHLSLHGMEQAISEALRIARHGVVLGFFIMVDAAEHNERMRRDYYWNELSASRIEELLRTQFGCVTLRHIPTFLANEYGAKLYYNNKAWTAIAEHAE